MPLILLLFALIVGIIVYLKGQSPAVDPNSPQGQLQAAYNAQIQNAAATVSAQTSGATLSPMQQAQVQKFAAIASVAGTATAAGVAGLSSLTLAAAGPIGAVVAGLIIAFGVLRGTAHLVANTWTSDIQAKFNNALAAISGEVQRAQADGSVSKAMLAHAMDSVGKIWAQYYALGEQFASRGADYRLVIDQSYCDYINYRCPKGHQPLLGIGLVNKILADMQDASSKLKV